jgi:hypothetical protein
MPGNNQNQSGFGPQTFTMLGSGVSDIFSGFAELEQSQGAAAEAQQYGLAAACAGEEATYSQMSTAIQAAQKQRELASGGRLLDARAIC